LLGGAVRGGLALRGSPLLWLRRGKAWHRGRCRDGGWEGRVRRRPRRSVGGAPRCGWGGALGRVGLPGKASSRPAARDCARTRRCARRGIFEVTGRRRWLRHSRGWLGRPRSRTARPARWRCTLRRRRSVRRRPARMWASTTTSGIRVAVGGVRGRPFAWRRPVPVRHGRQATQSYLGRSTPIRLQSWTRASRRSWTCGASRCS
jgi:hypothetical protein